MHVGKILLSRIMKSLRVLLPLLLTLFLLISNNQTSALKITKDYVTDIATVKSPSVTLNQGTKGSSTISTTTDYAKLNATAGFTFYENSSDAQGATAFSIPTSSGSFTVPPGSSIYLYSPTFPSATTVYSGSWMLDIWASSTSSGVMSVSFVALDSINNTVALAASGNTTTIGTSKSEVNTTFSGIQITVPSSGCLVANITNPTGSGITYTIYWGSGQPTNYQTPADYDYIVAVANSASASVSLSLSAYSSSGINRLTNLTVNIYSPRTNQIIIINGSFTQSSGSTMTLSASSTLYIQVHAAANSFGSSNVVLLMKYGPDSRPFAYDVISLTVN